MILHLQRLTLSPATLGTLSIAGVHQADTLERPWLDNAPRVSCIPPGRFRLTWEMSPRLKRKTLRLKGVPGRWGILIHPANHVYELQGCISLGKRLSPDGLIESRKAVEALERAVMADIIGGEVWLEIRNPGEA